MTVPTPLDVKAVDNAVRNRPRFKEDQHPRDRKGRFIQKGARVKIGFGSLGTVVRNVGHSRIEVSRDSDKKNVIVSSRVLTVVANPDGTKPGTPGKHDQPKTTMAVEKPSAGAVHVTDAEAEKKPQGAPAAASRAAADAAKPKPSAPKPAAHAPAAPKPAAPKPAAPAAPAAAAAPAGSRAPFNVGDKVERQLPDYTKPGMPLTWFPAEVTAVEPHGNLWQVSIRHESDGRPDVVTMGSRGGGANALRPAGGGQNRSGKSRAAHLRDLRAKYTSPDPESQPQGPLRRAGDRIQTAAFYHDMVNARSTNISRDGNLLVQSVIRGGYQVTPVSGLQRLPYWGGDRSGSTHLSKTDAMAFADHLETHAQMPDGSPVNWDHPMWTDANRATEKGGFPSVQAMFDWHITQRANFDRSQGKTDSPAIAAEQHRRQERERTTGLGAVADAAGHSEKATAKGLLPGDQVTLQTTVNGKTVTVQGEVRGAVPFGAGETRVWFRDGATWQAADGTTGNYGTDAPAMLPNSQAVRRARDTRSLIDRLGITDVTKDEQGDLRFTMDGMAVRTTPIGLTRRSETDKNAPRALTETGLAETGFNGQASIHEPLLAELNAAATPHVEPTPEAPPTPETPATPDVPTVPADPALPVPGTMSDAEIEAEIAANTTAIRGVLTGNTDPNAPAVLALQARQADLSREQAVRASLARQDQPVALNDTRPGNVQPGDQIVATNPYDGTTVIATVDTVDQNEDGDTVLGLRQGDLLWDDMPGDTMVQVVGRGQGTPEDNGSQDQGGGTLDDVAPQEPGLPGDVRAGDLVVGDRLDLNGQIAEVTGVEQTTDGPSVTLRFADGTTETFPFGPGAVLTRAAPAPAEPPAPPTRPQRPARPGTGRTRTRRTPAAADPSVVDYPRDTVTSRPVLYTYQRKNLVALGLADDQSQSEAVRQAAARIRARKPLSAEHSATLAAAIREKANADGVRPVQQRALNRLADRLDAASALAAGRPAPVKTDRKVTRVNPTDLGTGDTVALPNADGSITVGQVVGARSMMRGRLVEVTVRDQHTGQDSTRIMQAGTAAYVLPDLPEPEPITPPQVRDFTGAHNLNPGDTITQMRGGVYVDKTIHSIKEDGADFEVVFQDEHGKPDETPSFLSAQGFYVRTGRGASSSRFPGSYISLPPDNGTEKGWRDVNIGDRIQVGPGDNVEIRGTVIGTEPINLVDDAPGVRLLVSDDTGSVMSVDRYTDDQVMVLAAAHENVAPAIARAQDYMRRREIATSVNGFMSEVQGRNYRALSGVLERDPNMSPEQAAGLLDALITRNQGQDYESAVVNGIINRLRRVTGDESTITEQNQALRPQIQDLVAQIRNDALTSMREAITEAEPMPGESRTEMLQRIGALYRDNPPTGFRTAAFSLVAAMDVHVRREAERSNSESPASLPDGSRYQAGLDSIGSDLTPEHLRDRMNVYRLAMGGSGANFGQGGTQRKYVYRDLTLESLDRGNLPTVQTVEVPVEDQAADGGPGAAAMAHLSIVRAAGQDMDRALQANIDSLLADQAAADKWVNPGETMTAAMARGIERAKVYENAYNAGYTQIRTLREEAKDKWAVDNGFTSYNDFNSQYRRGVFTTDLAARNRWRELEQQTRNLSNARIDMAVTQRDANGRRQQEALSHAGRLEKMRKDAQRKAVIDLLSSVRGVGQHRLTYVNWDRSSRGNVLTERNRLTQAMRQAEDVMPTDWLRSIEQYVQGVHTTRGNTSRTGESLGGAIGLTERARGGAAYDGSMRLDGRHPSYLSDSSVYTGVAVHELGHFAERAVPGLVASERAFLWSRTSSGEVGSRTRERLRNLSGRGGDSTQFGYDDQFQTPYSGVDYMQSRGRSTEAYELFTTGIESLVAGSPYINGDDDFRHWLLGNMALLGTPDAPSNNRPAAVPAPARRPSTPRRPRTPAVEQPIIPAAPPRSRMALWAPQATTYSRATPEQKKMIDEVFKYEHAKSGFKVQLSEYSTRIGPSRIMVTGDIVNKSGRKVGTVTRSVTKRPDGRIEVHHDYLSIQARYQGNGFANDFYEHLYRQYPSLGATDVTIQANIDVGGYAWAQRQFEWDPDLASSNQSAWTRLWGSFPRDISLSMIPAEVRRNLTPEQISRYEAFSASMRAAENARTMPSPKELANALKDITWEETTSGGKKIKMWPGKKALLGRNWYGKFMLPGHEEQRKANLAAGHTASHDY